MKHQRPFLSVGFLWFLRFSSKRNPEVSSIFLRSIGIPNHHDEDKPQTNTDEDRPSQLATNCATPFSLGLAWIEAGGAAPFCFVGIAGTREFEHKARASSWHKDTNTQHTYVRRLLNYCGTRPERHAARLIDCFDSIRFDSIRFNPFDLSCCKPCVVCTWLKQCRNRRPTTLTTSASRHRSPACRNICTRPSAGWSSCRRCRTTTMPIPTTITAVIILVAVVRRRVPPSRSGLTSATPLAGTPPGTLRVMKRRRTRGTTATTTIAAGGG